MDEGGFGAAFESETGVVEARALATALAGHVQRQTQCLEIIAACMLADRKKTLPEW